jgi:glycerol-3-phosphate dehydrogenase (NAD(P)+)
MITVGILGYGEIGRAIDAVLSKQTHLTLERWDKNVDILPNQPALATMIPACDVLFVCIPTWLVRSALHGIREYLKPETIVVSVSKGFEKETCTRVDDLFSAILGNANPLVFLGGPMIAEELVAGTATKAIAASANAHARTVMSELFAGTIVGLETSDDFEGVITAASLKNIYALGLGMSDALDLGANAHGVFLAQALHEMTQVVVSHGGRAESALGLAGLADLVATSQSQNSTNYTTGVRFARGLAPLRGSEALNTLPCIVQTMSTVISDLPFLRAIHAVVMNGADARHTMLELLA